MQIETLYADVIPQVSHLEGIASGEDFASEKPFMVKNNTDEAAAVTITPWLDDTDIETTIPPYSWESVVCKAVKAAPAGIQIGY